MVNEPFLQLMRLASTSLKKHRLLIEVAFLTKEALLFTQPIEITI